MPRSSRRLWLVIALLTFGLAGLGALTCRPLLARYAMGSLRDVLATPSPAPADLAGPLRWMRWAGDEAVLTEVLRGLESGDPAEQRAALVVAGSWGALELRTLEIVVWPGLQPAAGDIAALLESADPLLVAPACDAAQALPEPSPCLAGLRAVAADTAQAELSARAARALDRIGKR